MIGEEQERSLTMTEDQVQAATGDEKQYVSFILDNEEYGVPILKVQEIIRFTSLTRVPRASEFIEGVLNLRGRVIPVIDLRKRFSLPQAERDRNTRIVVVEVDNRTVGIIVDGVREVLQINSADIEPAPPLGSRVRTDFIEGMGKVGDRLMILLEIDKILSAEEKTALEEVASTT
jgi:purine-binding chemotaxis protein CheW